MAEKEVYEALSEVLVERLRVDPGQIRPDADLFEDIGLDSIDMMTAVMAVEERFGIEVSDKEVEKVRTLAQAAELLSSKVAANV